MRTWRDECGVFGIWNDPEASRLTYLGLYAQQHRGQESAGMVSLTLNDGKHHLHKALGLVADVFRERDLNRLKGSVAIGHVRYSTTGTNDISNAQPLTAGLSSGPISLAHNGNIVNAGLLRKQLIHQGAIFQGNNDTECLLHLMAKRPQDNLIECIIESAKRLQGAYSLLLLSKDRLVALRDPYGFRPLVLGRKGAAWVLASETCAFDLIGASYVREILPGEIFWVDSQGEHTASLVGDSKKTNKIAKCVFEHVYFARPDSIVYDRSVYESRKKMGQILARENPAIADIVVPVPDSGVPAAIGYSVASGYPFELGIVRNHYVGRTFIEPKQSIRSFGVKVKLNPQSAVLKGKRVVVVDDSLVRGTTCRKIIQLIRQAGAIEVHLRIASPPTTGPCHYGVDTPKKSELIASYQSIAEICQSVGADSLGYLSIAGLMEAVDGHPDDFCAACFSGNYPVAVPSDE